MYTTQDHITQIARTILSSDAEYEIWFRIRRGRLPSRTVILSSWRCPKGTPQSSNSIYQQGTPLGGA